MTRVPIARRDWTIVALSMLLVAGIAVAVYARALDFAFFNDDPTGHFAWMEGRALTQFFTSAADYGYYRPIVFVLLRAMETLFGGHNSTADHAMLLLLHGANVALVWLLGYRLSGRSTAFAWLAGLVFLSFPFNFEAVAYVASLTHPLLVFWLLLTLWLFDRGRRTGSRPSYGAALLTMILGLLSHENGLFIPAALIGQEWVIRRPLRNRELFAWPLWAFLIPPIAYGLLWMAIPKNSDQALLDLPALVGNTAPFMQTLVYPLLPLARLEVMDTAILALLAVGVTAVTGLLARQIGAMRLWAYALGWTVLSAVPAMVFLSPAYVYGSPRLSYLPAIGVAMLWAIPVLWLWHPRHLNDARQRTLRLVTTVVYALVLILPPLPFISCQLDFYAETSRIARTMALSAATAREDKIVFVNAPFFFSSYAGRPDGCPNPYPWAPIGGVLIPPYAQARDFVRFNGGPDRAVSGVTFSPYQPGWRTFGPEVSPQMLRLAVADDTVFVFDLMKGSFIDLSAIWRPDAAVSAPPLATFGDTLTLTDVSLNDHGDRLAVSLDWVVATRPAVALTLFVHVYDATGALAAQADGPLGAGLASPHLWESGDVIHDERLVDVSGLETGDYTVVVGMYEPLSGQRLPGMDAAGALADDALVVGHLKR